MLIRYDRNGCIGCGACVSVCPQYWVMGEDEKSDLRGGQQAPDLPGVYVLKVSRESVGCNRDASENCPVKVIHILEDADDE